MILVRVKTGTTTMRQRATDYNPQTTATHQGTREIILTLKTLLATSILVEID